MNKNLAITVLTWNDWKNTVCCLESIYQSSYNNFDVILVNNNSDKEHIDKIIEWSKNKIKAEDEEIEYNPNKSIEIIEVKKNLIIENKGQKKIYLINSTAKKNERWAVNLGCTAGLNLGYRFSLEQKYEYIGRVDCDFIVTKDYLEGIINTLENNNDFIAASPKIIHGGLRHTIWWHGFKRSWSFLKFHRLMNLKKKRIIDDPSIKGIVNTDAVCGCCSVYKSKGLLLTGLGDEDFFFGPEDMELSFRLSKFGRLVVNLDLKTFHKIVSSSKISGWLSRSYYEAKGFLILIKKSGNFFDKIIGYPYFLLRIPYFLILLILKKREKDRVFGFCLGCYDFFFKKR
jgi:GT2 family glycosyltransferase